MSANFPFALNFTTFRTLVNGEFEDAIRLNIDFYYTGSKHCSDTCIPAGFTSDGASVPKILWRIYPPFGKYLEAAVVHDWFCVLGNKGESPIDSVTAAKVFREAMVACGVGKWRRNKMYWAVRFGGPRFKAK
tara:strand:- start:446 stop:841 length:396 start_codon:yes stop_codon:yes gene_type:complete